MGLIRKTMMVGTMGVVRGSSKKQRVAKAQLKELRTQTAASPVRTAGRAAARLVPVSGTAGLDAVVGRRAVDARSAVAQPRRSATMSV
jgi:hypothetical protein